MNFETLYTDLRDRVTLTATPAVMMPRFGVLPELEIGRVRYLIGRSGMYMEARSIAVHACLQISHAERLPFGVVTPFFRALGGPIPQSIHHAFKHEAHEAAPNEYAALVLWDGHEYHLHRPKVLSASAHRIQYSTTDIDPLTVMLDVHSHGDGPAFFSSTDDEDDLGNPSPAFMAMVLGQVRGSPQIASRMVINGRATSALDELALLLRN